MCWRVALRISAKGPAISTSIDHAVARHELEAAYQAAQRDTGLSAEWLKLVRRVWRFSAKTYTPALGTVLLAKSVEPDVDPGAIKVDQSRHGTFSLRTLAHEVLVPESNRLGFSIRTTGREPLNNQPFFRYAHVGEIDRVRVRADLVTYRRILALIGPLDRDESRAALASFVRVGIDEGARRQALVNVDLPIGADQLVAGLEELLRKGKAGPWVVQALGAVMLEAVHPEVVTRRLNDPSRDFPGDVQALDSDGNPVVSLEARNKRVTANDVTTFVEACSRAGIERAILLVLGPVDRLPSGDVLAMWAWREHQVALHLIESIPAAVGEVLTWAPESVSDLLDSWAGRMARRLEEIEAPESARELWATLVVDGPDTTLV